MKITPFLIHISVELQKKFGEHCVIKEIHPEFGGSINESFKLVTTEGNFFLKRNNTSKFPDMFEREAEGLKILRTFTLFKVPAVIFIGSNNGYDYLLIEYLQKENATQIFWKAFGTNLAQMHKQTSTQFGIGHDNFIGSLNQHNTFKNNWSDFFVSERIVPLVSQAHENGKLDLEAVKQVEKLCYKIPTLFPKEPPALLHGDLWSGNYLCTSNNTPAIFDPAVYYGHREMDLAMMHLFGGFHADTYKAYQEIYPLEPSWKERIDICNIYPLLVHTILFGGSYVKQVKEILNRFA